MAECHPVGFRWVMEAKRARRDDHPRRPALHAHERDGGPARAVARRERHRVPRRARATTCIEHDRYFRGLRGRTTRTPPTIVVRGLPGHRGPRRPVLGLRRRAQELRHGLLAVRGHLGGAVGRPPRDVLRASPSSERGAADPERRRTTRPSRTRAACSRSSSGTSRATPRRWSRRSAASRPSSSCRSPRRSCDNSGRERTSAFCYAVGLDAAHGRRAVHPHRGDPPVAARQHRASGRRDHGAARPRLDPGLHRHPDALQPAARLPPDAQGGHRRELRGVHRLQRRSATGWWASSRSTSCRCSRPGTATQRPTENDWCFDYLPHAHRRSLAHATVADMADGKVKGYFVMGENPTVGSMHGALQRKGTAQARVAGGARLRPDRDRRVLARRRPRSRAARSGPRTSTPRSSSSRPPRTPRRTARSPTPSGCCSGTTRRSSRRVTARSELHFMYHLGAAAQGAVRRTRPSRRTCRSAHSPGTTRRAGPHDEPDRRGGLQEINGYTVADRRAGRVFHDLARRRLDRVRLLDLLRRLRRRDQPGARRQPGERAELGRARVGLGLADQPAHALQPRLGRPRGQPWSERKRYVWWDEEAGRWTAWTCPTSRRTAARRTARRRARRGIDAIAGDDPFIMQADGKGWLFAPNGLLDGPLPTHYEPQESPVEQPALRAAVQPGADGVEAAATTRYHRRRRSAVSRTSLTTYRLTEHHTAGGMSRWLSWLSELQPEMFCEISPGAGRERGVENGGWATITHRARRDRGRVLVTDRVPPLRLGGRVVHQIGMPYHWGAHGLVHGRRRQRAHPASSPTPTSRSRSARPACDIVPGRRSPRTRVHQRRSAAVERQAGSRRVGYGPGASTRPHFAQPHRSADGGLLHRHHGLHRLQGVRGGLQAVEPAPRRRPPLHRDVLRQHRRARRLDLAARRVHRAAGPARTRPGDRAAALLLAA